MTGSSDVLLALLAAFLITFLATRHITTRIRAGQGRLGDISIGALHVHHMVWGVGLVLVCGTVEFALVPKPPWQAILAAGFGAGGALILDEFALILHLRDVYWSEEGRSSIDAVIVVTVLLGMLTNALDPSTLPKWGPIFLTALVVTYVLVMAICLAKGRSLTAIVGIFIPYVLLFGALRLARPNSMWARLFYRGNLKKQRRALVRFDPERKRERRLRRLFDGIGVSLEPRVDRAE